MSLLIPRYPDKQLATGNNNAAGLSPIEYILKDYEANPLVFAAIPPKSWGTYDPGVFRIIPTGVYTAGYAALTWPFAYLTRAQVRGLMDGFCAGGYSGLVTVRDRTDNATTYANYNALMILPKLSELRDDQIKKDGYTSYVIRFQRVVAL